MPINPLTKHPSGVSLSKILNTIEERFEDGCVTKTASSIVGRFRDKLDRIATLNIKDREVFKDLVNLYRDHALDRASELSLRFRSKFCMHPNYRCDDSIFFDMQSHTLTVIHGLSRDAVSGHLQKHFPKLKQRMDSRAKRQKKIYQ